MPVPLRAGKVPVLYHLTLDKSVQRDRRACKVPYAQCGGRGQVAR
jgi:hypothetical protein